MALAMNCKTQGELLKIVGDGEGQESMTSLLEWCVDHKKRLEALNGLLGCTSARLMAVLSRTLDVDLSDHDKTGSAAKAKEPPLRLV